MKKVLVFLLMVVGITCFAAPPPDVGTEFQTEIVFTANVVESPSVMQNLTMNVVPDVASINIGYSSYLFEMYDAECVVLPEKIAVPGDALQINSCNKSPSFKQKKRANISKNTFQRNSQHCNFGYPFTANYLV